MSSIPRSLLRIRYEESAEAYLRSLPPEHFMESISQARQRTITLESFDLFTAQRPDVQVFNELLVQYPGPNDTIRKVVPDNMVVLFDQPIKAKGSYDLPLQPVGPFLMLEYVSKYTKRKDYEDNFEKYEQELKVPYYLLFYPDAEELTAKTILAKKLNDVIDNRQLTQSDAAELLGMPQPKVSAIRNYKLRGISLERLMQALVSLDQHVEIVVRPARRAHAAGITVAA